MSFDLYLVNDDISIMPNGSVRTITDTPKLRQDVLKILITELGSNKFHRWYGSLISANTIGKNLPQWQIEAEIASAINQATSRLQALQKVQISYQNTTLAELIAEVGDIRIQRNPADPRQINVIVTVLSRQLTKIEEIFTIIA